MKTRFVLLAVAMAAIGATPLGAQAQRVDGRWTPWLGCWRLLHENVRTQDAVPGRSADAGSSPLLTVCVEPSGTTRGVTMTTFADGKQVLTQTIVADAT